MRAIWRVTVEVTAGTWLIRAIEEVTALADHTGAPVTAKFNGKVIEAKPGESAGNVMARYQESPWL